MTSTEERFARATRTSHLKIGREEEEPRDAERIWAAGSAQTRHDDESHKHAQERSLGVLLTRLRIEWDAVSSEIKAMHRNAELARIQRAEELAARKVGPTDFDFEQFDAETASALFTARALIMMNLRSLAPAKRAMLNFALAKAEGKGCGSAALKAAQAEAWWAEGILARNLSSEDRAAAVEDHAVAIRAVSVAAGQHHLAIACLIGQVMDAWLDRLCYRCNGRGFSGGWSTPKIMCPSLKQGGCDGTGSKRLARFGSSNAEHFFGLWVLNVMDSKVQASMGRMAKKARMHEPP
jgi:hypothetical protein